MDNDLNQQCARICQDISEQIQRNMAAPGTGETWMTTGAYIRETVAAVFIAFALIAAFGAMLWLACGWSPL